VTDPALPAPAEMPTDGAPPLAATPARSTSATKQLLFVARRLGLGDREPEIRCLARPSLRLTHANGGSPPSGRSWFGGRPDLPPGLEWPQWKGQALTFLLQIDLGDAVLRSIPQLPQSGVMLVFAETSGIATGHHPEHAGAHRILLAEASTQPVTVSGVSMELSAELVLPRVWSAAVQSLNLSEAEQRAWEQLRHGLAQAQGVVPLDAIETPPALHRLFGYPDERHGLMPLTCELLSHGSEVVGRAPHMHPRAQELEPSAARWRLALQVSADPFLGWTWAPPQQRLYLWGVADDLEASDCSSVWGILQ
jgi:hypothetical protein